MEFILLPFSVGLRGSIIGSIISDRCEILARSGRSLHVSLIINDLILHHVVRLNLNPYLAGSTLLPLTMSGGLSGAVSPTGGRYGSVTIDLSYWFDPWMPHHCADAHSADLLLLAFLRSSEHCSFLCQF